MRVLLLISVSLLLFYGAVLKSPKHDLHAFYLDGYAQGTTWRVTYYAPDSLIKKAEIGQLLSRIDSSLSIYKPYSLISVFNNSGQGVKADPYLKAVAGKSLEIFRETNGLFDFTVYPLVQAWGFGTRKPEQLPDSARISSILPCIGSENIFLRNDSLLKGVSCAKIDVNGIAQGYSVDILAGFLESKGIANYLVDIGGELRIKGRKPDGSMMRVGIESPAKNSWDEQIIQKIIQVEEGAVTTSGNYRKYTESGNKRLSHLIDPRTGYPIETAMVSVTVIAKDAMTADGYDNALMAMNVDQALQFMERHKDMEAYFIYRLADGAIADTATTGFKRFEY